MNQVRRVNTHNKSIKPWFNKDEWKRVYELLFKSEDLSGNPTPEQLQQALLHLNVWKSRVDLLPSAIEGSIIILEALNRDKSTCTDIQLREAHSFTILRFLNICVASRTKQGSFKATAISHNIPRWIIEIRNDISHDQKLPSLVCLDAALRTCFQWLKTYYWDAEYEAKKDFVPNPINTSKVESLIQVYFIVLAPDYNHDEIVDILIKLGVTTELTRKNLKGVILNEIALSLPIPDDSAKILCNIVINSFIKRYLIDESSARKIMTNKLDQILNFLYENKMLCIFVELLLNLNKRYYQDHVLYFYSKVLDRIFTSLHFIQMMKQQNASLIQFKTPNTIKFAKLKQLHEFEIFKPTPNVYSSNYMESFSKLINQNMNTASLTSVLMLESVSAHKLQNDWFCKEAVHDYSDLFKKCDDAIMDEVVENRNDEENNNKNVKKIWSIVEDTSIFQKCALGDFPAAFFETAADALYNYIK